MCILCWPPQVDPDGQIKLDRLDLVFDALGFLTNIKRVLPPPRMPPTETAANGSSRQAEFSGFGGSGGMEAPHSAGPFGCPGFPFEDTDTTFAAFLGSSNQSFLPQAPDIAEDAIVRARILIVQSIVIPNSLNQVGDAVLLHHNPQLSCNDPSPE